MSVRITTDIFCDQCSNWEHGVTCDAPDIKSTRKALKKLGWTYKLNTEEGYYEDLCPACSGFEIHLRGKAYLPLRKANQGETS